ncbi:MAG: CDP-alcohol phosphatidyltransferase family protein [Gemmatimonadaceae bacterium]
MKSLWERVKNGALRLLDPVAEALARMGVSPNALTTIGAVFTVAAAVAFGFGHIMLGGWVLSLTAFFDVLDGRVARRANRATVFGAFYDSTLDRVGDGALMAGLTMFYATSPRFASVPLMIVCLVGMVGTFVISYTRARAEALGIDAKVGFLQRPERFVLLSAPQALFGLALGGKVLAGIVILLAVTAWITAIQRILFVRSLTTTEEIPRIRVVGENSAPVGQQTTRRAHS